MEYRQKIISIKKVTHDVRRIRIEKPAGYQYVPGQATDVCINKPGWIEEKRPFTFTCLAEDPYLEFSIKSYMDHDGVTKEISKLKAGDELVIGDAWGAIEYKGEGFFIAGGAGITPFMAILRRLHRDGKLGNNTLFFSNKTIDDIIYEDELSEMLGDKAVYTLTKESREGYLHDKIDGLFLDRHVDDFSRHFYVCGPDPMIHALRELLKERGASPDEVVFEK